MGNTSILKQEHKHEHEHKYKHTDIKRCPFVTPAGLPAPTTQQTNTTQPGERYLFHTVPLPRVGPCSFPHGPRTRNEPVQPTTPKAKSKMFKQGTADANMRSKSPHDFKNRPAPNITKIQICRHRKSKNPEARTQKIRRCRHRKGRRIQKAVKAEQQHGIGLKQESKSTDTKNQNLPTPSFKSCRHDFASTRQGVQTTGTCTVQDHSMAL